MIKGIAHTAYTVKDMEASLDFYCDKLGFTKLFELQDEHQQPWIVYLKICEGQFIELFYGGEKSPALDQKTIGYNHLCLEVENMTSFARELKSKGVSLDVEVKQGLDKNRQCWVRDPDGNRIEFMQYHPESPQMTK
ncbi:VOC family protein [Bacillaceae bacterium SIJ1]|uniref:VOC family protein n=1 Tax=Litoribacterium kuwaitense TaxID=1398745 RepID=UPI0013EB6D89|nr:VOC family protein [Litoribacterium kuwaitense]NGP45075.1 VOC family protein [Litoribacterium kuwaitense]